MKAVNVTWISTNKPASRRLISPSEQATTQSSVTSAITGYSSRMALPLRTSGRIRAASPRMARMLNMFEPTTLATAISVLPLAAAIMLTASSGTDVPAATTVSPITAGVRRNSVASPTAPRNRVSHLRPPGGAFRRRLQNGHNHAPPF